MSAAFSSLGLFVKDEYFFLCRQEAELFGDLNRFFLEKKSRTSQLMHEKILSGLQAVIPRKKSSWSMHTTAACSAKSYAFAIFVWCGLELPVMAINSAFGIS